MSCICKDEPSPLLCDGGLGLWIGLLSAGARQIDRDAKQTTNVKNGGAEWMDGNKKPMIAMLAEDFGQGGTRNEPDAVVKVESGIMMPAIDSDNCPKFRRDSHWMSASQPEHRVDVGDYGRRNVQSTFSKCTHTGLQCIMRYQFGRCNAVSAVSG